MTWSLQHYRKAWRSGAMKSKHHQRRHDLNGRKKLKEICIGNGLDIGSCDRPIHPDATTIDIDPKANPDIVADMMDIPLPDNSQDYIIASHCLEHIDNTIDTLKEWYRLLKVGGKVGIMVPHGEYVDSKTLGDSEHTHRQLLTEKTTEKFLKYVGFKEVDSKRLQRPLAHKHSPAVLAFAVK